MSGSETFDLNYVKKFPGYVILIKLICCFLGFMLSVSGPFSHTSSAVFFSLTTLAFFFTSVIWIGLKICKINRIFSRDINWNFVGLVQHGAGSFFLMVASCALVDNIYLLSIYRAAGVFGFLAFSASLVCLAWEFTSWYQNKDVFGQNTATVVEGPQKPVPQSDYDSDEWSSEGTRNVPDGNVVAGTYNQRSSYIQPQSGLNTPFLPINALGDPQAHAGWDPGP